MKLGIVGSGNTAASTALALARDNPYEEIIWTARTPDKAMAALRDVASAYPDFITHVTIKDNLGSSPLDVVLVTAGSQIPAGGKARDGLKENVEIIDTFVKDFVSKDTVVVLLASPVDEVTEVVSSKLSLPTHQIIGFGGDLDLNRLSVVLNSRKIIGSPIHIIGEHGARTIPVYSNEDNYDDVTNDVRQMFKTITHLTGSPRNLATGVLMARLLKSLTQPIPTLHYVNTFRPEHDAFLTWPTLIGKGGASGDVHIDIGKKAQSALSSLLDAKKDDQETRKALLA